MNIYLKKWKPEECDHDSLTVLGLRWYKQGKDRDQKFKAYTVDVLFASKGMLSFTFINKGKAYSKYWKIDRKNSGEDYTWKLFRY